MFVMNILLGRDAHLDLIGVADEAREGHSRSSGSAAYCGRVRFAGDVKLHVARDSGDAATTIQDVDAQCSGVGLHTTTLSVVSSESSDAGALEVSGPAGSAAVRPG